MWANGKRRHKHDLRQCFHKQIKELWKQPLLNEHFDLVDPTYEAAETRGSIVVAGVEERPSVVRSVGAYNFASIVSSEINLVADLTAAKWPREPRTGS